MCWQPESSSLTWAEPQRCAQRAHAPPWGERPLASWCVCSTVRLQHARLSERGGWGAAPTETDERLAARMHSIHSGQLLA